MEQITAVTLYIYIIQQFGWSKILLKYNKVNISATSTNQTIHLHYFYKREGN